MQGEEKREDGNLVPFVTCVSQMRSLRGERHPAIGRLQWGAAAQDGQDDAEFRSLIAGRSVQMLVLPPPSQFHLGDEWRSSTTPKLSTSLVKRWKSPADR